MYAKGMTTRQISETIEDIYGFETSESFISDVTDKILPQIEDWQNRPLDEVYPILYIDAIHYSVRDNGIIRKLAAYVIPSINTDGKKEVLTIGSAPITKYYVSSGTVSHLWTVPLLFLCGDCLPAASLNFLHGGFNLGFGWNIYHANGSKVNVHLHSVASVYLLLLSVFKL